MRTKVSIRSVFFGTPQFATPSLRALAASTEVVAAVCQPDRPRGRGMRLQPPPVKELAEQLGIPTYQPMRVRDGSLREWLQELRLDVALVVAYGRILPPDVLSTPRRGCMNLHASILPAYRGAAPIQWALRNGETQTGISLMQMDEGMDTGPVYAVRELAIEPTLDAGALTEALSELAAAMVGCELLQAVRGELSPIPQPREGVSHAPPIRAEHQAIDFRQPARAVLDHIRSLAPRPGAHASLAGRRLKILEAALAPVRQNPSGRAGVIEVDGRSVYIVCGAGQAIELRTAQLAGRRAQAAADLVNGRALRPGDRFDL